MFLFENLTKWSLEDMQLTIYVDQQQSNNETRKEIRDYSLQQTYHFIKETQFASTQNIRCNINTAATSIQKLCDSPFCNMDAFIQRIQLSRAGRVTCIHSVFSSLKFFTLYL